MNVSKEIQIDLENYYKNKAIIKTHPIAILCWTSLTNWLFLHGISVRRNNVELKYDEYFKNKWKSFALDVMMEKMCRGIIPVTIVEDTNTKQRYPVVPNEPHVIKSILNPKLRKPDYIYYRAYSRKNNQLLSSSQYKKDKNVKIFSNFGYDPDEQGKLQCPLTKIIPEIQQYELLSLYASKSEIKKAEPDMLIESTVNTSSKAYLESLFTAVSAPNQGGAPVDANGDKIMLNQQSLVSILKDYHSIHRQKEDIIKNLKSGEFEDDTDDATSNMKRIPSSYKFAHEIKPANSDMWEKKDKQIQENICSAFGIPKSIILDSHRVALTGVQTAVDMFHKVVVEWRTFLTNIMTELYFDIYGNDYAASLTDDLIKEVGDPKKISESMIEDYKKKNTIQVTLDIPPNETQESLIQKYVLGIIEWEDFYRYSRMITNIDIPGDSEIGKEMSRDEILEKMGKRTNESKTENKNKKPKKNKTDES